MNDFIIDCRVVAETDAAYKLTEGDDEDAVWFPKSQIGWDVAMGNVDGDPDVGDTITFYIPEWLAEKKGWM